MTFRIAHISDTHLSRDKPFFVRNFAVVAAHIGAERPDIVINSGDMALDGPGREADLADARRMHDSIGISCRFIPGNHDIGESQDGSAHPALVPITRERRECYQAHFGADFWRLDVPGWRLVGLDAQLLGSDLPDAAAQLEFLRQALNCNGEKRIALFIHKPLFLQSPDEEVVGGRFVDPEPRRQLLEVLRPHPPALVCSGHVHQYLLHMVNDAHHVWAPSTGFILPDVRQPRYGIKEVGYVEHRLEADGSHDSRFVSVPGLPTLSIDDFPDAYDLTEGATIKPARTAR